MSLASFMNVAAVIKHRNPSNDVESATGEKTTVGYDTTGTTVYCHFEPGGPSIEQVSWGVSLNASAVIYVPAGTDIRPDLEDSNGLADKVTINSKDYIVSEVLDVANRGKFLVVGLKRSA